jgi:hypothetical protein
MLLNTFQQDMKFADIRVEAQELELHSCAIIDAASRVNSRVRDDVPEADLSVTQAYQGMLGFYQTHMYDFGWSKDGLVRFANDIIMSIGAKQPPAIDRGIASKLGLLGTEINISKASSYSQRDGYDRGAGRGDYGAPRSFGGREDATRRYGDRSDGARGYGRRDDGARGYGARDDGPRRYGVRAEAPQGADGTDEDTPARAGAWSSERRYSDSRPRTFERRESRSPIEINTSKSEY